MEWMYDGTIVSEPISDSIGFVYIITNNVTGRRYVGKKLFFFSKTKRIKGKVKRIKAESDWRDYWSSSDELKADVEKYGRENFSREIIHVCKNKGMMNYLEAREQFERRVLESDEWYNGYIMVRCHRSHVQVS
jgi:hypothetical protein